MAHTTQLKSRIKLEKDHVFNTYGSDYGADEARKKWDVKEYCRGIEVKIGAISEDGCELNFDLINIEPAHANALRRILIAEVPTMAIEKVYMWQNTSVIQDEVLAHRLGLIPIKADPAAFKYCSPDVYKPADFRGGPPEEPEPSADQALIFELNVKCRKKANASKESGGDLSDSYEHLNVYSGDFKWIPIGDQALSFQSDPPRPMVPDILIAKLRPGNEIELRAHCVKGLGRDHAKFSPVATASYRLLPAINLKGKITGEAAHRLKASFSEGVIEIDNVNGEEVARVADARRDMCSRNVFQHPDLAELVELTRERRHYIFSVESTGAVKSADLVVEACKAMQEKVNVLRNYFRDNIQSKLSQFDA